jgi:hypothetical protein
MRRPTEIAPGARSTFGAVFPGYIFECVVNPNHLHQLRFDIWNGHKTQTANSARVGVAEFSPATIVGAMARAVHFPPASKCYASASKLARSVQNFFSQYAHISLETAALLTAFGLATWFVDTLPVAPVLFLLGDEHQTALILRLLGAVCRRSILLADLDIAALRSLPAGLHATLLIKQRDLPRSVNRFLLASADPHFLVARGTHQFNTCSAKVISAHGESVNGMGLRLSLSPQVGPLPLLSDAQLREFATDFQAKLLRYRQVNWQCVCDAQPGTGDLAPALQGEFRAWMAPISEFPNLRKAVLVLFDQRNHELEADRLTDDRCLVAEMALFFCHSAETRGFFVGQLAQKVNDLLQGRHEDRFVTHRKVGALLKELGINKTRVVKGYRVFLTDAVRNKIHDQARAYGVLPVGHELVKCSNCIKDGRPN